jgi:hypothetical protein
VILQQLDDDDGAQQLIRSLDAMSTLSAIVLPDGFVVRHNLLDAWCSPVLAGGIAVVIACRAVLVHSCSV